MNKRSKNYITQPFAFTLVVVVVLLSYRYIPQTSIFGINIKRADIVADIVGVDTLSSINGNEMALSLSETPSSSTSLEPHIAALNSTIQKISRIPKDTLKTRNAKDNTSASTQSMLKHSTNPLPIDSASRTAIITTTDGITQIEDYTTSGRPLAKFSDALRMASSRPVRIAFVGDSFIEGDMLTSDLRETLQTKLGGRGVGFVPITSIVSKLRQTITHTFSGWKTYSIKKKNEQDVDSKFIFSNYVYKPIDDNATLNYRTSKFKKRLPGVHSASFFFINTNSTVIYATLNDSTKLVFNPEPSTKMQKITIDGYGEIASLGLRFSKTSGFYAYGASFDGTGGVALDNFGDRGSSGLNLSKLSADVNPTFNKLNQYDLIVLEYGLNVVSSGTNAYTTYQKQMTSVVQRIKQYYPTASILIMGVSDRSHRINGEYKTMPEIKSMISHQRAIAKDCEVAFWDTFSAMGGDGSMAQFVAKKWASKDYTHVSPRGAAFIAEKLADAIILETQK